jgi:ATP-binding cassette, subfamily B, bacterial
MKNLRKQTIQFYLKHLSRYKVMTAISVFSIVMAITLSMVFPVIYKEFIDTIVEAEVIEDAVHTLLVLLVIIVGVDIFNMFFWRALLYTMAALEVNVMRNILDECFEHLHQHSYNFFSSSFTGGLVKKVNRISYAFEGIFDIVIFEFIPIAIRTIIANGVLLYLSWQLGVPLLIWSVLFVVLNYYVTLYKIKHYDIQSVRADTKVTATLADTIMNNINIKLFANLNKETAKFKRVSEDWRKKKKAAWFFGTHVETVQGVLAIGLNTLLLFIAIKLWEQGVISVGDFVLIQFYLIELFRQLWHFGHNLQRLYERFADAEEMTKVLNTDWAVQDEPEAKKIKIHHGRVEFKNVRFAYEEDGTGVIKGLSLKVKPSEKIALIGPSGGGKSTIFKLLLRLFDVQKGEILVDGQDISQVTQDSLRKRIALVPQDPILFHRTIMENIRYGRLGASDKEVMAAARLARCHDFINKFPKKYKTFVGERGVKLSGGERQRVAIARAILSNTKILILDEATSSLDSESEKLIQEALANLMKHKTTFIIAHRLSTIVNMDRIVVLDGGRIVEQGTHHELIRQKNSLYEKLWGLQVGGYLE